MQDVKTHLQNRSECSRWLEKDFNHKLGSWRTAHLGENDMVGVRHLEKGVARCVELDPAHKRKLVEIVNDDGPRESGTGRDAKKENRDE